jgi:hypothetical protein
MNLLCVAILFTATANQTMATPLTPAATQDAIDRAFHRMFNADFIGAQAIIAEEISNHPENPFVYSLKAAALLFSEFDRMQILELDFFADDESITDRKRLKPDMKIRTDFFRAVEHARNLSLARLAIDPKDVNASLALFIATGVETDYTLMIEKSYRRGYSLSKETQKYANKLLAMNPPIYDAYLSPGMLEYGVGNLNWFFKLFVHFDQIKGSKQKAIEYLKLVIDHGRYYSPYAKILLSVMYLRDKKLGQALDLLKELEHDFPDNPLIHKEVLRVSAKIGSTQSGKSSR